MNSLKLSAIAILLMVTSFSARAQSETTERQKWLKANNFFEPQDAIDFITQAYAEFTPVVAKRKTESGIYKRTIKLKNCELVITTEDRVQESSIRSDHEYERNIVVIQLDKMILEGTDIKPSSEANANGLFGGHTFTHSHKMPSFSITSPVINKDDPKYAKHHYEEHLKWAYWFLIDQCKK